MWAKGRFDNMVEFVTKAKELGFTRNFLREKGIADSRKDFRSL
ncbi:unnamed protein product [marine sediment metagenome]|uniref:Uncharacterized protein n=1 Tax=marine sediment metagenome TaxID=412755 RepID=X1B1S2_9ZZZZ